jgi:Carbohydrate esterase, sialic acid-specific acetylesterase
MTSIGKYLLIFTLGLLVSCPLQAQPVTMFERPQYFQLYPRDGQDSCAVPVAGVVLETGYSTATLAIIKDHQVWRSFEQPLVYSGGTAEFSFAPKIHAELSNHRFVLQIDGYTIMEKGQIVCGDVIVLNGQSNTVAPGETDNSAGWVRTFGGMWVHAEECFTDTTWAMALSDMWPEPHAAVGVWGIYVANKLSEYLEIPIAVINGAKGGSLIMQHQRNDNEPWDLDSIYGRLLFRLEKSGLRESVRAILWHQGESDTGPNYSPFYAERWDSLYQDWHEDYPALESIYMFQVRNGVGNYQDWLRETQRQIPFNYDNINIMSTAGIDGFDHMHYNSEGYEAFGDLIWPLVARDLYQRPLEPLSDPPDFASARFVTANQDQIAIEFNQPVSWPADTLGEAMRRYFYIDENWGMVQSGEIHPQQDNVIMLNLEGPRAGKTISYVPVLHYHGGGYYDGPWIRNPRGIGALLFSDVPLEPAVSVGGEYFPQVGLQPGDSLFVEITLTNTTGAPTQRDVWTEMTLNNGDRLDLFGPQQYPIQAEEQLSIVISHRVPDSFPIGTYGYRIHSGLYPDMIAASDTLMIQVTD